MKTDNRKKEKDYNGVYITFGKSRDFVKAILIAGFMVSISLGSDVSYGLDDIESLGSTNIAYNTVSPGTPTSGNYRWHIEPDYNRANTTIPGSAPGSIIDSAHPGTPAQGNYRWAVEPAPPFSAPTSITPAEKGEIVLPPSTLSPSSTPAEPGETGLPSGY